jgi:hypothetical protein
MSKYILGQSHEGEPVITNEKSDATADLIGNPICMGTDGKIVIANGVLLPYGVVAGKGLGGNLSVIQSGLKVFVKTDAPVSSYGGIAYITPAGVFSTDDDGGDNQATGAKFVAPDGDYGDGEAITGNFALINFGGGL